MIRTTKTPTQVFAYLRVSDPSQIKGDGFTRQLEAITNYAKANKLQIHTVYREKGISGGLENRPTLAEMLVSLEQNGHGVKTVIIEKLDRLARDYMIQEFIIRDFQKQGFNIISSMEGPDLCGDDPTRKLIRTIMGGFSEYDKTMIVLKLKAARQRIKAKTGKCEGRKGYSETETGRETLERIEALRTKPKTGKQLTWQQIADQLNADNIPTMDGKQWSLCRVQQTARPYKAIKA